MEFICGLAEKLSSCNMLNVNASKLLEECALYSAKEGFYEKPFLWNNVSAISPIAWWNGYCSRQELHKIACRILRLPAASAAVERSFSCYSNVHTAKQNRLSNERAAKVVYVSQNVNLCSESPASRGNPVNQHVSESDDAMASFTTADSHASCSTQRDEVIEIDSCDNCDSCDSYD